MKCAVSSCKETDWQKKKYCHKKHITFYSFPKDIEQRKLWIKFCKRNNTIINLKRERICSLHFTEDDFERNLRFEMGFSNRRSLKLKPGVVPTLEPINTSTNDIKKGTCEWENSLITSDSNGDQRHKSIGCNERFVTVPNTETSSHCNRMFTPKRSESHLANDCQHSKSCAYRTSFSKFGTSSRTVTTTPTETSAINIVNASLTLFEEEHIPMTIIKKVSNSSAELKPSKVPIVDTSHIKIEDEEVIIPTIETTAIKKEIGTYSCKDRLSNELEGATVPFMENTAIKIENAALACDNEENNTPMRTDIKTESPECIEYSNRFAPELQMEAVSTTEKSAIKLESETLNSQTQNISTEAAINQGSQEQQPRTVEFIVFVPYRIQIRDPSI